MTRGIIAGPNYGDDNSGRDTGKWWDIPKSVDLNVRKAMRHMSLSD